MTVAALAACHNGSVSFPVPESDRDTTSLAPISAEGDTSWRVAALADLREHSRGGRAPSVAAPRATERAAVRPERTERGNDHGFSAISPASVNAEPDDDALDDAEGPAVLRTQVLLDRARFSGGVLNGKAGQNVYKALLFFQDEHGLPATGRLDRATYDALRRVAGTGDAIVQYTLTSADIAGPYFWVPVSVYEQERLPCTCYASALEMLNERFHTVTDVLRKLNPDVQFATLRAGQVLWVPNVEPFDARHPARSWDVPRIVKIRVAKSGRYLHALAADGSIVYHFPTTVGSQYDPSPSGNYHVDAIQWRPVFHYDPRLYSDVSNANPRATLPPGPNSPVGIVWIATSKDHVGIHGTPLPHTIGLASSHGCVRLANWDAARLAASIRPGIPVEFMQ